MDRDAEEQPTILFWCTNFFPPFRYMAKIFYLYILHSGSRSAVDQGSGQETSEQGRNLHVDSPTRTWLLVEKECKKCGFHLTTAFLASARKQSEKKKRSGMEMSLDSTDWGTAAMI